MESWFATLKKEKLYQLDTTKLTVEQVKTIIWRYTFLKMQQLNKISILETVALMRRTRIRQSAMFALSKLDIHYRHGWRWL